MYFIDRLAYDAVRGPSRAQQALTLTEVGR
jgi:hypothetical protein